MRIAVSGSHGTGKSTLIAAFLDRRPAYAHEPEAYETLADEVDLAGDEGPTPEGLESLLRWTLAAVARHAPGARVVHERSPVDYLAYAAASRRAWPPGAAASFVEEFAPAVRTAVGDLDLIAYVPVTRAIPARPDEDPRFRRRVDRALRRALLDDEHDLLAAGGPTIVELPAAPDRQLAELLLRASG
jgi:AAA domain-containing protein